MNTILFKVNGNRIRRTNGFEPTSGEKNYSQLKFVFDEEWEGVPAVSVLQFFDESDIPEPIVKEITDNTVVVPVNEKLRGKEGILHIGVAGAKADGTTMDTRIIHVPVGEGFKLCGNESTLMYLDLFSFVAKLLDTIITEENPLTSERLANLCVESWHIKDFAVTHDKIAPGAVRATRLGQYAVTAEAIAFDAVETEKIKNGAVTTDKLGGKAVTGEKIADDSIDFNHLKDGAVNPDVLDREYLRLHNFGTMPGTSFHTFLLQNADELAEPYKKMFIFISRGDGVLTTSGAGRCIGLYVGSGWFQFKNLNTGKTYNVTFTEDKITDFEEAEGIADHTITPEKLSKNYVEYATALIRTYGDLDAIISLQKDDSFLRLQVSGLCAFRSTLGEGYFTAFTSSERGELTITNQTTGEMWLYKEGTEELVSIKQNGGTDSAVGDIQKTLSLMVGGI